MHIIKFVFTFAFTIISITSFGASTVKGIVKSENPIEFAVVTLLKAQDSSLVKGAITDANGVFVLEAIPADTYYLSVSFTGYDKSFSGPYFVTENQTLDIPTIQLVASKTMDEVTVSATRPLFEHKAGKIVMNVESSPVRIAGTAWDLLGKCPGVFIDQNNNITLKGKSGVQVYIDDRPTYLNGDALKSYLQGIPAADIVSVEIISNPSARYDAEGTGGILNLVSKKGSRQGLNASARLGAGMGLRPKYSSGFNFNYAKEKFNIYGNFGGNLRHDVERIKLERSIPYMGDTTAFSQSTNFYHDIPTATLRLGIDFNPNSHFNYGFRVDGYAAIEKTNGINTTYISDLSIDSSMNLNQKSFWDTKNRNGSGSAFFKNQLDTLGQEISASIDYLQFGNLNLQNYDVYYYDANGNQAFAPSFQRSDNGTKIRIGVGKIDYVKPFSEKFKFEAGVKSSYVRTENKLLFEVQNNSVWEYDSTRSNEFNYTELVNAAYVNGTYTFSKLEIMGGLRLEQTLSDGESPTTGQRLKRSYINLFPSLFITHKINEKHVVSYTYTRRINRPDYEKLNPFAYYLDQYTYNTGNPFLQPEIQNSVDITYVYSDFVLRFNQQGTFRK
jgi:iron complex outermembrane recepter protein